MFREHEVLFEFAVQPPLQLTAREEFIRSHVAWPAGTNENHEAQ